MLEIRYIYFIVDLDSLDDEQESGIRIMLQRIFGGLCPRFEVAGSRCLGQRDIWVIVVATFTPRQRRENFVIWELYMMQMEGLDDPK